MMKSKSICDMENIKYVIETSPNASLQISLTEMLNKDIYIIQLLLRWIKILFNKIIFLESLYEFVYSLNKLLIIQRFQYNNKLKIILKERPALIVVINDQKEVMIMNIAKKLGIFIICMGWSTIATSDYYAKKHKQLFLKNRNNYWMLYVLRILAPESVYRYEGEYVLLMDPIQILSYLINGIKFTTPGKRGSLSNLVTATSVHEKNKLLRHCIPSSKIILNGDNQNDRLIKLYNGKIDHKTELRKHFDFQKEYIGILVPIPQIFNVNVIKLNIIKKSLITVIQTLLNVNHNIRIIAKVHPRDNISDFNYIKELSDRVILINEF